MAPAKKQFSINKPPQQASEIVQQQNHQLKDFDTPIEIEILGGVKHCFSF